MVLKCNESCEDKKKQIIIGFSLVFPKKEKKPKQLIALISTNY